MPHVNKDEVCVKVCYELKCGYERATALANDLNKQLADDKGYHRAEDITNGFVPNHTSYVEVTYMTLKDANRLDETVRKLLSRKVDFTYTAHAGVSYGSRGGHLSVRSYTEIVEVKS